MVYITELKQSELQKIHGGGLGLGQALAIIGGIIFLIGVFDGYQPQPL